MIKPGIFSRFSQPLHLLILGVLGGVSPDLTRAKVCQKIVSIELFRYAYIFRLKKLSFQILIMFQTRHISKALIILTPFLLKFYKKKNTRFNRYYVYDEMLRLITQHVGMHSRNLSYFRKGDGH